MWPTTELKKTESVAVHSTERDRSLRLQPCELLALHMLCTPMCSKSPPLSFNRSCDCIQTFVLLQDLRFSCRCILRALLFLTPCNCNYAYQHFGGICCPPFTEILWNLNGKLASSHILCPQQVSPCNLTIFV